MADTEKICSGIGFPAFVECYKNRTISPGNIVTLHDGRECYRYLVMEDGRLAHFDGGNGISGLGHLTDDERMRKALSDRSWEITDVRPIYIHHR